MTVTTRGKDMGTPMELLRGASPALLDRMVMREYMASAYQPIVRLDDRSVTAVEALARPHGGASLDSVAQYFARAVGDGSIRDLDWQCRRSALVNAQTLPLSTPLCVKLELGAVDSPRMDLDRLLSIAEAVGRPVASIVLEISARDAMNSVNWPTLDTYREAGFRVAVDGIDDAGLAASVVRVIDPDILKIDRGLTARLDSQSAVIDIRGIVRAADATGAAVVAQGIETEGQALRFLQLGVGFGQGYHLGMPDSIEALRVAEEAASVLTGTARSLGPEAELSGVSR